MPFKPWLKKINPWLIAAHFIAFWMFANAFWLLSNFYNINIARIYLYSNEIKGSGLHKYVDSLPTYMLVFYFSPFAGLLVSFIIALITDVVKKWFWLNSFIAFIIAHILFRFDITGWVYLKKIFLLPGAIYKSNLYFYLITNASVLLLLGLICLFSKRISRLVEGYNNTKALSF